MEISVQDLIIKSSDQVVGIASNNVIMIDSAVSQELIVSENIEKIDILFDESLVSETTRVGQDLVLSLIHI